MGLDMYLKVETYMSGYSFHSEQEKAAVKGVVEAAGLIDVIDPETPSVEVTFTAAYWRKAGVASCGPGRWAPRTFDGARGVHLPGRPGSSSTHMEVNIMEPIRLPITTDDIEDTTLGRVLLAGRLVVTMRSKLTGVHMTVQFQGKAKVAGRWRSEPFPLASHVFIDVPQSGDGGFNDKVGTLYPLHSEMRSAGMFWPDRTADPARVWCAWRILEICAGLAEMETDSYEIMVATHCYRCGRELTEPESIEAGMGPKCGRIVSAEYGTRHQAKQKVLKREVEEGQRPIPEGPPIQARIGEPQPAGEPHTTAHIKSTGDLSDLL